jgi:hypothetical protein
MRDRVSVMQELNFRFQQVRYSLIPAQCSKCPGLGMLTISITKLTHRRFLPLCCISFAFESQPEYTRQYVTACMLQTNTKCVSRDLMLSQLWLWGVLSPGIQRKLCLLPPSWWFFAWLILSPWRWKRHAPPKCPADVQLSTWCFIQQDRTLHKNSILQEWANVSIHPPYSRFWITQRYLTSAVYHPQHNQAK